MSSSKVAGDQSKDYEFVHEMLFTTDYGDANTLVSRWEGPIVVDVSGDRPNDWAYLKKIIDDVNAILEGSSVELQLRTLSKPRYLKETGILVVYAPAADHIDILEYFHSRFFSGEGKTVRWVDGSGSIGFAIILVTDELYREKERMNTFTHELFHALGVQGHSGNHPESVLYRYWTDVPPAIHFAPIDKKLLYFLYHYLKPGDDEAAVRKAFDEHWHTITID